MPKKKKLQYSFYFAGDLFDHKQLTGNKLLADEIFKQSKGKFKAILPQDHEQSDFRSQAIRDQDLKLVLKADLALFNFDNGDVDSGTVAEFMYAKMLDIPSVILRTDFRAAGDGLKDGDPWNLMLSNFPRTAKTIWNGMALYQSFGIKKMYKGLASAVIEEFDRVLGQYCTFKNGFDLYDAYRIASIFPGKEFIKLFEHKKYTTEQVIDNIVTAKINKGIYKWQK